MPPVYSGMLVPLTRRCLKLVSVSSVNVIINVEFTTYVLNHCKLEVRLVWKPKPNQQGLGQKYTSPTSICGDL